MDTIKFRDKDGKMRTGKMCICQICNSEFITRIARADKQKCCSQSCAKKLISLNKTSLVNCSWCQKEFRRKNSRITLGVSKSGLCFCTRKCKDEAQKLGGIKEIMPDHFGTGTSRLQKHDVVSRFNFLLECFGCKENREYLLCIHHIDGNSKNNTSDNLEVLCHNCHTIRHLEWINGVWQYNTRKLTPRDMIDKL